jgi:Ala-tRNA(Pro) deacylase
MKENLERIKSLLKDKGIPFEVSEHEAVYTSEEAASVRGVALRSGVKALVCKSGKGFIMVLVRADKRANLNKIASLEGVRKIYLASPEEVKEATGCEIGSVPPFGFDKPLKTYIDRDILNEERVNFNAGLHKVSVSMKGKDLERAVKGILY